MKKKTETHLTPDVVRFSRRAVRCHLMESPSFGNFSLRWMHQTRAFKYWERFIKYFRRFRFITTAFRIAPWILLAIQTHTLLYALVIAALLGLPPFLSAFIALFGAAALQRRGIREFWTGTVRGKTVYVLFPTRGEEFLNGKFWRANAQNIASADNCAVIVVSPYLLSPHGILDSTFYRSFKQEASALFLIRTPFFFSLQKHILKRFAKRLILLY